MFMVDWLVFGMEYDFLDILLYTCAMFMIISANAFLNVAVKCGHGGVVQSLENLKVLWQTLIMYAVSGGTQIPTAS